jgi:hypothetical protein
MVSNNIEERLMNEDGQYETYEEMVEHTKSMINCREGTKHLMEMYQYFDVTHTDNYMYGRWEDLDSKTMITYIND